VEAGLARAKKDETTVVGQVYSTSALTAKHVADRLKELPGNNT